jgi:polysaccharide pyruvyl transferase WcaK-like protein
MKARSPRVSVERDGAPKTIGLLDHMGYGNLGDAAIQEAVIANIRRRVPNAQLVGFSLIPDDTRKRHGIPCYPIRWSYPKLVHAGDQAGDSVGIKSRLKSALKSQALFYAWAKPVADFVREALFWVHSYRALRRLDLLIVSGSGQLGELWRGPWSHPYTIFKFSLLAKLAHKKLYFLNCGAGPLEHPLSQFFARWALHVADYRSFRDHDSEELVRSLGVKAKTHVYPDPAYALEVEDLLKSAQHSSSTPVIGLNPIGFCDPRIWPRQDDSVYQEYLEKITGFSTWLLDQGYTLRVFTTETSVDRYAIEDLKARLRARSSSPEVISQVFKGASETVRDVLREMAGFDFIVTSKFHGIIFSHLLRKPVIALSYHRKMDVAMRGVGQGHFCADIERFSVDWLIEAFRRLVKDSSSIKAGHAGAVEAYSAGLAEQFDGLFLSTKAVGPGAAGGRSSRVAEPTRGQWR